MLTTGDLSVLFSVTSQTVINWLEEGRIPFERIGRGPRRVSEQAVLRYIEQTGLSLETLDVRIYSRLTKLSLSSGGAPTLPAVVVLDVDARIISWNDGMTALFGLFPAEMVGSPIDRLFTQVEGKSGGLEYQTRSLWQGQTLLLRTKHVDRSGTEVKCLVTVSRVFFGPTSEKAGYALLFRQEP